MTYKRIKRVCYVVEILNTYQIEGKITEQGALVSTFRALTLVEALRVALDYSSFNIRITKKHFYYYIG